MAKATLKKRGGGVQLDNAAFIASLPSKVQEAIDKIAADDAAIPRIEGQLPDSQQFWIKCSQELAKSTVLRERLAGRLIETRLNLKDSGLLCRQCGSIPILYRKSRLVGCACCDSPLRPLPGPDLLKAFPELVSE